MKLRKGFVTNSSSSSFILGFKDEDSIYSELCSSYKGLHLGRIVSDVDSAEKHNVEGIIELYKNMIFYSVRSHIRWSTTDHLSTYEERVGYEESKEFKDAVEKEIDKRVSEFKENICDNNVFVELEYSDEGGDGELEHDIVPYLDCCVKVISHH